MNSEFLASLWKYFRGRGLLNHTPCRRGVEMACYFEVEAIGTHSCSTCVNAKLCGTVSWVKILWFTS